MVAPEEAFHLLRVLQPQLDLAHFSFLEVDFRHEVLSEVAVRRFDRCTQNRGGIDATPVPDSHMLISGRSTHIA